MFLDETEINVDYNMCLNINLLKNNKVDAVVVSGNAQFEK